MGCKNTKPEVQEKKQQERRQKRIYTDWDNRNVSLLQACIENSTDKIITSLAVKTTGRVVDLSSPYNGVPIFMSCVLALLNDRNEERFMRNWKLLADGLDTPMPTDLTVDIRVTYCSNRSTTGRTVGGMPVLHFGNLHRPLVSSLGSHIKSVRVGMLKGLTLSGLLSFVSTNIRESLEKATDNGNMNSYQAYIGTFTHKMEQSILKNIKTITDEIEKINIQRYWANSVPQNVYYHYYQPQYTVPDCPPPPYAPTNGTAVPTAPPQTNLPFPYNQGDVNNAVIHPTAPIYGPTQATAPPPPIKTPEYTSSV
jgi:hypothetical protein